MSEWQERERVQRGGDPEAWGDPAPHPAGDLRRKFDVFLDEQRLALAREFTAWSQKQARRHYRADDVRTGLAADHWPTTFELFHANGDDCDGLDLIAYNLLRESGFPRDELYRVLVRRDRDAALHMVTLWFQERDDPWVIDVTGAMTLRLRRFSDVSIGWTPLVVFNEDDRHVVSDRSQPPWSLAGE